MGAKTEGMEPEGVDPITSVMWAQSFVPSFVLFSGSGPVTTPPVANPNDIEGAIPIASKGEGDLMGRVAQESDVPLASIVIIVVSDRWESLTLFRDVCGCGCCPIR